MAVLGYGLVEADGAGRLICLKTEICGGLSLFWLNLGKPPCVNSMLVFKFREHKSQRPYGEWSTS